MFTTTTLKALMTHVSPPCEPIGKDKVSIIGIGTLGAAIAFGLLTQKIATNLVLIDPDEAACRGEMLDIQHATMYLGNPQISSSTDLASSRDSQICIITVGAEGSVDDKLLRAQRNTEIFKIIIPSIIDYSPHAILIIVSNPVDVLTYVAWKLSGFPPHRVIGAGTVLESTRFRYLLAQKLNVSTSNLHAFVIGEQGPNSVPVWSGVSVSGVRLRDVNKQLGTDEDPEDWTEIYRQVVESEYEVEKLKNCGTWGMAITISRITKAILQDTKECFPISTHIRGCRHGVNKDVFLSLPCILGNTGVTQIVRQKLNDFEKDRLQTSADNLNQLQQNLDLR